MFLLFQRRNRQLLPLGILLLVSNIIEGIVYFKVNSGQPFFIYYHIFIPVDFVCLCLLFYNYQDNLVLRKIVLVISIVFVAFSYIWSFLLNDPWSYPGLTSLLRGTLLIILSVLTLFTFSSAEKFYKVPVFWICIGVLMLYSGGFLVKGFYNILLKKYPEEKAYFKKLHSVISIIFNYLFYCFIITGLLCSRIRRK